MMIGFIGNGRHRRAAIAAVVGLALVAAACGGDDDDSGGAAPTTAAAGATTAAADDTSGGEPATLRLGYFPNVTHAPAILGVADGTFAKALGSNVDLELSTFNAGTDVDLSQIRYLELRTESGATVDPQLVLSHVVLDDFAF